MLKSSSRKTDFCFLGIFSNELYKLFLLKSGRSIDGGLSVNDSYNNV